jgi:ComF family protein
MPGAALPAKCPASRFAASLIPRPAAFRQGGAWATLDIMSALLQWLHPWWVQGKNILWPQFCRQCAALLLLEDNGYFCPDCWERSPLIRRPFCNCCGRPHAEMRGFGQSANYPCAECREKRYPHVDRIFGAARYEAAIADAIKLLKFHGKTRLARPLAERMADFAALEMECDSYDWLVPVPLHRVRERHRGFNQSLLLAEALAPAFPRARLSTHLRRIRPTRTQSRLTPQERRRNLQGAFAVIGEEEIPGRVLLVDDVVTTAATVCECARALKIAGATTVDIFAVALSAPKITM